MNQTASEQVEELDLEVARLRRINNALLEASDAVVAAWESGNLAAAVRHLAAASDEARSEVSHDDSV